MDAFIVVAFAYEDIVRFSDFLSSARIAISIDSYVMGGMKTAKMVSFVTIKFKRNQAPQIYIKEQYQMENGRFKLISEVMSITG